MAVERSGSQGDAPESAQASGVPADPSMEDILASIRRILSEDEAPASPPPPPPEEASASEPEEPLELTEEMQVLAQPATAPAADPAPVLPPAADVPPSAAPTSSLLAPAAAAAAAASVSNLLRAVSGERTTPIYRGGPSIEDVVRDELRPLLKAWLDEHLPPLVERLVRAEIERVMVDVRP